MNKIYILSAILLLSLEGFGQRTGPDRGNLVAVSKGDSFSIRSTNIQFEKRNGLKSALRLIGIGAMTYQADRMITKSVKGQPQDAQVKNSWAGPVGAGIVVSSDALAGHKNKTADFLRITLYNKDLTPVYTSIIRPDRRSLLRNGGILLAGKIPENGYIGIGNSGDPKGREITAGLVLDVLPGEHPAEPAVAGMGLREIPGTAIDVTALLPGGRIPRGITGSALPAKGPQPAEKEEAAPKTAGKYILTPAKVERQYPGPVSLIHGNTVASRPVGKKVVAAPLRLPPESTPPELPFFLRFDWIQGKDDNEIVAEEEEKDREPNDPFRFSRLGLREGEMPVEGLTEVDEEEVADDDDGGGGESLGDDDDGSGGGGGGGGGDVGGGDGGGGGGGGDDDEGDDEDAEATTDDVGDGGNSNFDCTDILIDGGSSDDYQSCICSYNPDDSACSQSAASGTSGSAPDPKCVLCLDSFEAAINIAVLTYAEVSVPACIAGAASAEAACLVRARNTLAITLNSALVAYRICLLGAGC